MSSHTVVSNTEAVILSRIIQSRERELTPAVARYLLSMEFTAGDLSRINELSAKARDGELTDPERAELDSYLHIGSFLAVMKSKARRLLRESGSDPRES